MALGIVAILLLMSCGPAASPGTRRAAPGSGVRAAHSTTADAAELAAASASLAGGGGPAAGTSVRCGSTGGSFQCGAPSNTPVSPAGTWTLVPPSLPYQRQQASAAYDAKDGYTVLFGGYGPNGLAQGDTWSYVTGTWTNLTGGMHPVARFAASMAYDATDHYVVLFGGGNGSHAFSDTWKFSAGKWTKLTPVTHPSARFDAGMAYDAADGEVVLFGGFTSALGLLGDTWAFKAGAWTNLSLAHAPTPRAFASLATDGATGGVLLFGGYSLSLGSLADTWLFKNKTWTQLHPAPAPSGRYSEVLTYDTTDGKVVFFGGTNSTLGAALSDTWTFSGTNWTKHGPAFHPSSRAAAAGTDGPTGTGIVLFGGYSYSLNTELNDTWMFKGNVWKKASPPSPAARIGGSMMYDEADGYVLLFGATGGGSPGHETWTFSAGHWTELHPKVSPSDRRYGMMAYDQADGYVVLFGGAGQNQLLNDTWTYSAGVWTMLSTPNAPTPRFLGSMTYDASDAYVLLFGGEDFSGAAGSDTWTFSSGVWTEILPATTPAARSGAALVYDSEDGFVLMFGGLNSGATTEYNDTWSFLAGTWSLLTGAQTFAPPSLNGASLVDDTIDGFPVIYGGFNGTLGIEGNAWAFIRGSWAIMPINGFTFPQPREAVEQMVYDAGDQTIVLFGGGGASTYGDTWELSI